MYMRYLILRKKPSHIWGHFIPYKTNVYQSLQHNFAQWGLRRVNMEHKTWENYINYKKVHQPSALQQRRYSFFALIWIQPLSTCALSHTIHTLLHHTPLHIYPLQHPIHISTRIRAHPMPHTRASMHLQLQIPTFILHLPSRFNTVSCCSVPIHDNSFAPSGPKSLSTQRAHNTH